MKNLFAILLIFCVILAASLTAQAQADRVTQIDSVKSSAKTKTFVINSRHNYNTVQFDSLATTDSIKIWHITETGKKYAVALRDLNTWSDLSSNLIYNVSGRREYLILHPNLYSIQIEYAIASPTKTIKLYRRGNNLK